MRPPIPLPPWTARRWRDAVHQHTASTLTHTVMRLQHRLVRMRSALVFEFGLTHGRLRIMEVLATNRPMCISDIARELDLTRQAVHRVVHDLARMRLVDLAEKDGVGGARIVSLAPDGSLTRELVMPLSHQWDANLAAGFNEPELRAAIADARRIRRNADRAWHIWPDPFEAYARSPHWSAVPLEARWPRPQVLIDVEVEADIELDLFHP